MELEAREPAEFTVKVCDTTESNLNAVPPIMNVEQAAHFAEEPFRIFVENDGADRDFLITFSNSEQKTKIEELEGARLIRFEHCGGITELPKKVAKFINRGNLNSSIAIAVFDCDAPQPNEASAQSKTALSECENRGVAAFRLKRRAIENYLLRSWLNTWVNETRTKRNSYLEVYKAFCELSDTQRAHFHMKKGLNADKHGITDGTINLYGDLSEESQRKLDKGFGNAGSDLYASAWVQDSQPSEDQNGWNEVNGIVHSFLLLCR